MNRVVSLTFFTYFLSVHFVAKQSLSSECPKLVNERLSRNVIPKHYDLSLCLNLQKLVFNGTVNILVNVKNETREITLHGRKLAIQSAEFNQESVTDVIYCKEEDSATLRFTKSIRGKGDLRITFNGSIATNRINGIYALRNVSREDVRYSVYTHFESVAARKAFPCFDEPNLKATFSISITAPSDRTVLCNMPAIRTVPISSEETESVFAKTPRMSTYNIAFVVGDFDFIERQSIDRRVRVRVYTPIGRKQQGTFALDVGVRCLDFLQKFLGIDYPLPKLDLVSLRDFDAGAMENWGLIVYIETGLLVSENASVDQRQVVAGYTCHEIAHQWFGNLVTPRWWTDSWLNEGFANFFEFFVPDYLFPQWRVWDSYLSTHVSLAMDIDALRSSHALRLQSVEQFETFDISFDTLQYNKGGSLLRMIYHWIGEQEFKKGLNVYLKRHQYKNADTMNVLCAMNSVTKKAVKKVMKNWFYQPGIPYLKVLNNDTCDRGLVVQKRFLFQQINSEEDEIMWKIPVQYSTSTSENTSLTVVRGREKRLCAKCVVDWNVGFYGYYGVQYTKKEYARLFDSIKNKKISSRQRFAVQSDYFAFVKAGKESIVDYLNYLKVYKNEDELYTWQSIGDSLSQITSMLSERNCSQTLNAYIRNLMADIKRKMDNTGANDDLTIQLKVFLYRQFGSIGDETIINDAFKRFNDYYDGRVQLNENFRTAIFEIVASNSTDKLIYIFQKNEINAKLRKDLANAMGYSKSSDELQAALDMSMSENVTISESITILSSVIGSSLGREIGWNFFVKHFQTYKTWTDETSETFKLITGVVQPFATIEKANEIDAFFKANKMSSIKSTLELSLDLVRLKAHWYSRDSSAVCAYLSQK